MGSFEDWILPLELDPSGTSIVFDEPSIDTLKSYLDKAKTHEPWAEEKYVTVSKTAISQWQLNACVTSVLDFANITTGLGYKLQGLNVKSLIYIGKKRYIMNMIACIHKPSRAFARALEMKIGYDVDSDISVLFAGNVIGFIAEERTYEICSTFAISDSPFASYSSSSVS